VSENALAALASSHSLDSRARAPGHSTFSDTAWRQSRGAR
jgi:hypothetical protein